MKKLKVNFMCVKPASRRKDILERERYPYIFKWPANNQSAAQKREILEKYFEYAPYSGEKCRKVDENQNVGFDGIFDVEFPDGRVLAIADYWLVRR